MAQFTTRLGTYLSSFNTDKNVTPYATVEFHKDQLFDFPLGWYNTAPNDITYDNFKTMFCLTHYMDEIGFETIGQFKLQLCAKLTELMPYYTQLYAKTVAVDFDPLINHEFTSTTTDSGQSNAQNNLHSRDSQTIHSDTPQINVDGNDYANALDRYKETALATNSETHSGNATKTDHGFIGDKSDAILKYRQTIININREILKQCDQLFMGIWQPPDYNFTAKNHMGWRCGFNGFIDRF